MHRSGSFITSFTLSHLDLDPPEFDPVRGRSPRIDVGLEKFGFTFVILAWTPLELTQPEGGLHGLMWALSREGWNLKKKKI